MREFELIAGLTRRFGATTSAGCLLTGIGDDGAVTALPPGHQLVSSIDSLLVGTHFPNDSPGAMVGYRALMVSLSDLAAMGAEPLFVLLALNLPASAESWALDFADGAREACEATGAKIAGGNLTRGPLAVTVSVHGSVPAGTAVLRNGARTGDYVYVSGHLGGAAAALRTGFASSALSDRFWRPRARVELAPVLRQMANAAIDISDGLLQDLGHLVRASGCGAELDSARLPVFPGATPDDAWYGGDDYELCFTAATPPPFPAWCIGRIVAEPGVRLDGQPPTRAGFDHFG